jgi:hypothetical protein
MVPGALTRINNMPRKLGWLAVLLPVIYGMRLLRSEMIQGQVADLQSEGQVADLQSVR